MSSCINSFIVSSYELAYLFFSAADLLFLLYLCYVISFSLSFSFLEHAGELRIFVLRGKM